MMSELRSVPGRDLQGRAPGPQYPRAGRSQAELLDGVLARQQLGGNDPEGREHSEPAVVDLTLAHLLVVLVQANGVAEVAGLLRGVLGPHTELQCTREREEGH